MMPSNHDTAELRILLTRIAQRWILFGRQSVGADVLWRLAAFSPKLTRDGGHLNRRGRKLAAISLIRTLGRLI